MRKYIQTGWQSFRQNCIPMDAPAPEVERAEHAFKAGAAGLHTIVMMGLSPGSEANGPDIGFMTAVQREIDDIGRMLDARYVGRPAPPAPPELYSVAQLQALVDRWDHENRGGARDPYEVKNFLEWVQERAAAFEWLAEQGRKS